MTKSLTSEGQQGGEARPHRCGWCGRVLLQPAGAGRPRAYCTASCRQQAYVARRLAAETGTDGLVVDRTDLERLLDRRFELELAAADARLALERPEDGAEALAWLLEHVDRLLAVHLRAAGDLEGRD